jgi:hypothetical protein
MNIALAGRGVHSLFVRLIVAMTMQDVKGDQLRTENQKLTTGFSKNHELLRGDTLKARCLTDRR